MKRVFVIAAAFALLCLGSLAQADVFNLGPGLQSLVTVPVGDAGNAADDTGYGAVGYTYRIGTYEVTSAQYCDFLNHKAVSDPYGLYNTKMADTSDATRGCNIVRSGSSGSYTYSVAADWANRPVNYVTYWGSCRFVNWLNNGQGNADMETGTYTLSGYNGTDGRTIARNANAQWFLPSENEWYKVAYYKGGGTNAGYWDYPTQSDTQPDNTVVNPDPGNNCNWYTGTPGYPPENPSIGAPYWRTPVGEFENSESAYGTFDQGGNLWERVDTVISANLRGQRGGACNATGTTPILKASYRHAGSVPNTVTSGVGFRVATVPEPSSLIAIACGMVSLIGLRRRRA